MKFILQEKFRLKEAAEEKSINFNTFLSQLNLVANTIKNISDPDEIVAKYLNQMNASINTALDDSKKELDFKLLKKSTSKILDAMLRLFKEKPELANSEVYDNLKAVNSQLKANEHNFDPIINNLEISISQDKNFAAYRTIFKNLIEIFRFLSSGSGLKFTNKVTPNDQLTKLFKKLSNSINSKTSPFITANIGPNRSIIIKINELNNKLLQDIEDIEKNLNIILKNLITVKKLSIDNKDIINLTEDTTKLFNELSSNIKEFNQLDISNINNAKELELTNNLLENILNLIHNIYVNNNSLVDAINLFDSKENSTGEEKINWAKKFRDAEDDADLISDIWQEYFETEWGDDAQKVKNLGKAFIQQVLKLGFTPETNPFLTFVKTALANNYNLNINNYGAIHNAYIDRYISKNDLLNNNITNILYVEDLYNKSGIEVAEYLKLQYEVFKAYSDKEKFSNNLIAQSYPSATDIIPEIFIENGNPLKLTKNTPLNGKLKTIEDINSIINKVWPTKAEIKNINQDNSNNIAKKLAHTKEEAINTILILISKYDVNGSLVKKAKNYKYFTQDILQKANINLMQASEINKQLAKFNLNKDTAAILIDDLAKIAGLEPVNKSENK